MGTGRLISRYINYRPPALLGIMYSGLEQGHTRFMETDLISAYTSLLNSIFDGYDRKTNSDPLFLTT